MSLVVKIMVAVHDDDHCVDHDDGGAVGFDDEHMMAMVVMVVIKALILLGGKSPRMQFWNVCKAGKVLSCLNEYVALVWHKDFFHEKMLGVIFCFFTGA